MQPLGIVVAELLDRLEDHDLPIGVKAPIQRGSAGGFVEIIDDPDEPRDDLLMVRMRIMRYPDPPSVAFDKRLLALNHALAGRAAFSTGDDGLVYLTAARPMEDLDPGELLDLIIWTADKADDLDDELLDEFGREWEL